MQSLPLSGLSILVVEDEALLRRQIAAQLERLDADVTGVGTLQSARKVITELDFDFVLLDVNLPDGRGTDLLTEKAVAAATGVIVMTADGSVDRAVEAMKTGALDYLVKPFDPAELPLVIGRARRARQSARVEEHRRKDTGRSGDGFFFGEALAGLQAQLQKILGADQRMESGLPPVLILGETGTGKTTIARWLHHHGPRATQPLIEVNCSALPETLAESELFGHERGAFTDARTARMGLFEAADGGTLFLDELPSLSLPLQAKVLMAIEDHTVRRLGGNRTIPVDVRIIAATNRDLKEVVATGQFREDLYHRLDLYRIGIVPLRERGEDVIRLAEQLMARLCQRHRLPLKEITALGKKRLSGYRWPGNVRELAHELERAIVFEESDRLHFDHLVAAAESLAGGPGEGPEWLREGFRFPDQGFSLEIAINRFIQLALQQSDQNVSAAARLLGVSRDYVRYRLANSKPGGNNGSKSPPQATA
jgi:two-component system, NtrC family, response regulator AtoC